MKKRKQKLVAVRVATHQVAGSPLIQPVEGGSIEDLLTAWRVVQIQPLGTLMAASGDGAGGYVALLLLEELDVEESVGRLGFAAI